MKKLTRSTQKAQGIVEYVLITALVALASMAMFKTFREDIRKAYKKAGETLIQSVQDNATPATGSSANE